jgi:hypothetical protein
MYACKPVLDATWATFIFAAVAFIMIPVGAVCLVYGLKPVEEVYRYDAVCAAAAGFDTPAKAQEWLWANQGPDGISREQEEKLRCTISIPITQDMLKPVYVYYELDGVYQNHRRYVRSRSDVQLAGKNASATDLAACNPQLNYGGNTSMMINPCGLVAWSNFNDSYSLSRVAADGRETVSCLSCLATAVAGSACRKAISSMHAYVASQEGCFRITWCTWRSRSVFTHLCVRLSWAALLAVEQPLLRWFVLLPQLPSGLASCC